jgi:hypothetical protein
MLYFTLQVSCSGYSAAVQLHYIQSGGVGLMLEGLFEKIFLKEWRPYLWIAGIGFLLYFKALFCGFVRFDDNKLIVDNYSFISNLANLLRLFVDDIFHDTSGDSYYRPLLALSLMIDSQFGKDSPFPFHLTNILLHLLACCVLFRFLTKMNYKKALVFLFTIAFTVHPVLTPAVAWIPGRNDSLLAVFVLLAFLSFLKFLQTKKWADYAWHILVFALAAFTKETAMMVIPICILYLYTLSKEKPFSFHQWILGLGWITTVFFWAGLRSIAVRGHGLETISHLAGNVLHNLPAVIQVWGKIFFPFNLSILPTIENTTFIYGIVSGLVLITALSFSHKVRYPYILFGLGWFFFFLLPTFNPTFAAPGLMITLLMEHRIYLPMMGAIMVMSEVDWIKESNPGKASHLVFL